MWRVAKVQTADIANLQNERPFPGLRGALVKFFSSEEGRSFKGGVHLGRGALSDNYGLELIVTATGNNTLNK